jgi:acyl-CoA thioester hydrolase
LPNQLKKCGLEYQINKSKIMIVGEYVIRTRYGEVDQMGYVYHANYVNYCHSARTDLMRTLGVEDKILEDHGIMLPVVEMNLKYKKPVGYDEVLTVYTTIRNMPDTRLKFEFDFRNLYDEKVCSAQTTVVFVDSIQRKPKRIPPVVYDALKKYFKIEV